MRGLTLGDPAFLGAASGFSPLSLSPSLWLDASDTTTITSSGSPAKVSQWNDRSGNGNNVVQPVAAAQPTTGATTQNAKNVLDFDGGDRLTNNSAQLVNVSTGKYSAFAVARCTVLTGSVGKQIISSDDVTRRPQFLRFQFAYGQTIAFNTSNNAFSDETANTTTIFVCLSTVVDANCEVWLDGSSNGGGSSITGSLRASAGPVAVGGAFSFSEFLTGSIAEIIIYPSVLVTTQRQAVETYLRNKWGTT